MDVLRWDNTFPFLAAVSCGSLAVDEVFDEEDCVSALGYWRGDVKRRVGSISPASIAMKNYIPITFLKVVALYLGIGLLIGLWVTQDIAVEDFGIGALCSAERSCFSSNAYLIPAVAVVWPMFGVYQPLVLLLVVAALAVSIWFMNRKKPVITSQKK